ncbi:MAG: hypothetical protein JSV91_04045 [Phycisphaerales bacterium]|nr:MAG: hypothetical protein JSV91_04045 [Phycisphaerales bacterium]
MHPLLVLALLPVLPLAGILLALYICLCLLFIIPGTLVRGSWLKRRFRREHGRRGKFILFVYSNSPNWQQYIEENIFPQIGDVSVVLNWSERSKWKLNDPWEAQILRHWGGDREFNPIAIIIPLRGRVRVVRFWQAFRDYKHGKDSTLRDAEGRMSEAVEVIRNRMTGRPATPIEQG